ncbi:MAG: glycosyltransferase [Opitutales bacterium]
MIAFACQPGRGSEPGIGWNLAREMAGKYEVWLLTRQENRPSIEEALSTNPIPFLHVIYCDLPRWVTRLWGPQDSGWNIYYYLWQIRILPLARKLLQQLNLDVIHHVTYNRYWTPSFVSLLSAPFLWGPVGGGESAPGSFSRDFGREGRRKEKFRYFARWVGEHDPFVHLTARHCALALATTPETSARILGLGSGKVEILGACGLSEEEIQHLSSLPLPRVQPVRFISIGRLLHWKGFHLGIRAFEMAGIPNSEYWIVGDGPERKHLEQGAESLSMKKQLRFFGALSRERTLSKLASAHVLVHPSLHDSGGWVCLEAMAAGRPVLCLDLGGPGYHVTPECGFKIAARSPGQVVDEMATAMRILAGSNETRARMGAAGQQRIREHFTWATKAEIISGRYRAILNGHLPLAASPQESSRKL